MVHALLILWFSWDEELSQQDDFLVVSCKFILCVTAQHPNQGVFTWIPHITELVGSFISDQIPRSTIKCSICGKHAQHCTRIWSIRILLLKNWIQRSPRQSILFPITWFWPSFWSLQLNPPRFQAPSQLQVKPCGNISVWRGWFRNTLQTRQLQIACYVKITCNHDPRLQCNLTIHMYVTKTIRIKNYMLDPPPT